MLRVRSLPGGAQVAGVSHEERQHGLLGAGRGGEDDRDGKCQGAAGLCICM